VRTKDYTVGPVAVFWIAADVYMAFGFAATGLWAWRFARTAYRRLAVGLRIAAVGLFGIVIGDCFFVPAIIIRWSGGDKPPATGGYGETILSYYGVGVLPVARIVLCLLGVTIPAALTQLAALRIWWNHLRRYRQLGPTMDESARTLPEDALHRVPGAGGVHRRYYRRVIECRDGLVRISPYLDQGEDLAAGLVKALKAEHGDLSQQRCPWPSRTAQAWTPTWSS